MEVGDRIRLVQTRLGQPREVGMGPMTWSSIGREPVMGAMYLTWGGLAGDLCTDTRPKPAHGGVYEQMHGGNDKAVYVYPVQHYPLWRAELGPAMNGRSFGENWRIVGADETTVRIGDEWQVGDALVRVSKPRTPCRTLGIYYGDRSMVKRMRINGLCGWYLQVLKPGVVASTAQVTVTKTGDGPSVAAAFAAKMHTVADLVTLADEA